MQADLKKKNNHIIGDDPIEGQSYILEEEVTAI